MLRRGWFRAGELSEQSLALAALAEDSEVLSSTHTQPSVTPAQGGRKVFRSLGHLHTNCPYCDLKQNSGMPGQSAWASLCPSWVVLVSVWFKLTSAVPETVNLWFLINSGSFSYLFSSILFAFQVLKCSSSIPWNFPFKLASLESSCPFSGLTMWSTATTDSPSLAVEPELCRTCGVLGSPGHHRHLTVISRASPKAIQFLPFRAHLFFFPCVFVTPRMTST